MPGIGSTKIGVNWPKSQLGLPASLLAKLLFLWTGRYTGDNHTVSIEVASGTDVTALTPTISGGKYLKSGTKLIKL